MSKERRLIALLISIVAVSSVTVSRGMAAEQPGQKPVSFVNDVIPALTRTGCNMGTCHGAAAGKNGFKLSLRGYAPEWDYLAISRQSRGRRINTT